MQKQLISRRVYYIKAEDDVNIPNFAHHKFLMHIMSVGETEWINFESYMTKFYLTKVL